MLLPSRVIKPARLGPLLAFCTNTGFPRQSALQARDGVILTLNAITTVPEPSTYALLALGTGVVLFTWLRRRRNST